MWDLISTEFLDESRDLHTLQLQNKEISDLVVVHEKNNNCIEKYTEIISTFVFSKNNVGSSMSRVEKLRGSTR